MTEAVSLKPELGRFGVWLPTRSITPELAAKIEALGYGAVWIGGSPDADLAWVEPALAQTTSLQLATGIVNIWSAPAPAVAESFHRIENAHPGQVSAGHRGGTPRAHRGIHQALRRTGRLPRRARRRHGADQPAGAGRAGPRGAAAGGGAQRGRPPVSDHAGAHGQGARAGRKFGVPGARAQGGAHHRRRRGPQRSAARPSTSTWA